jgi:hypothetical protein
MQAVIRQNSDPKVIKQNNTTNSRDSAKVRLDYGIKANF